MFASWCDQTQLRVHCKWIWALSFCCAQCVSNYGLWEQTSLCHPCTDRRTHASRRGLWERGVAFRGCALFLSFPFFPPSRPSSPPVLQPSPPLTYRLQVFGLFLYCDNSSHLFLCLTVLFLVHLGPLFHRLLRSSFKMCLPSPIATPHYGCRHFGSMGIAGETFMKLRRIPWLPADHISLMLFSLSLSQASFPLISRP